MKQEVQLGLKENWKQFALLVIINAFVGGMVGLERSILPQIAESEFHIAVTTAILSFIIVFGIAKAFAGRLVVVGQAARGVASRFGPHRRGHLQSSFRHWDWCT